jgi:hypothetical protein
MAKTPEEKSREKSREALDKAFLERDVRVSLGDLLEMLCHANNVTKFADTPSQLTRIFKPDVDYSEDALEYFKQAKSKIIKTIDKGLNIKSELEQDLIPFKIKISSLASNLRRKL